MANLKACMSHKSDEWGTPLDLFRRLDSVWRFNIDVCASKENFKCPGYFDKEEDALKHSWRERLGVPGRCFMNPPFSKLREFCAKANSQVNFTGDSLFVVALLPARTDTRAFHESIYGHAQIEFLKGRLRFEGAPGPAPFPSMIVTWRKPW
jgi:phage N-6-adenine-methyltransferase